VLESGGSEYSEREFGQVTIAAGETRELTYDGSGRIPVRGVAEGGWCVEIERERTKYVDTFGYVDGVLVGENGKFTAHVPGPGLYKVVVKSRPAPVMDRRLRQMRPEFSVVMMRRFVVDESTKLVDLTAEEHVDPTVAFVHQTLDSRGPPNVTFSHMDVQAAWLARHEDRAGVAAELLRILNDPHAPHDWTYVSVQALGGMTDTPAVVDGLFALLDDPPADVSVGSMIGALHHIDAEAPESVTGAVVRRFIALTRDDQWEVRWSAYYYLGRMTIKHPEIKSEIAPTMIVGLVDENERIRRDAAATIGWLEIKPGSVDLLPLLGDPSYMVRLAAARALWQTTGNGEALVSMATEILAQDNDDYEAKKDAALALRDAGELPEETRDALRAYTGFPGRPPFNNNADLMRFQLGSVAKTILEVQPAEQKAAR
jgi:hypothetical protein